MTSRKVQPPVIPGLRLKAAGDVWTAKYGQPFLMIECGVQRPECVRSEYGVFYIPMHPDHAGAAEIEAWRTGLAAKVADNERIAAVVRKRYHDYDGPVHAAAVRAAIAEGWALYNEHGLAVRKVTPLLRLLEYVYLDNVELRQLRKLIQVCRDNIANMEGDAKALAKAADVDLDDAFVERSIRLLTDLDRDRSKEANFVGWGRDTSAPGHWCCSLLKTDRAKAIEIGRGLVAHHLGQLAKFGVVPA